MSQLQLPKIDGETDILLDIYTHRSLRIGGDLMNEEYGDPERLAELGQQVLRLAVTFHFYSLKPLIPSREIIVCAAFSSANGCLIICRTEPRKY